MKILVLNCGSSTLKFQLIETAPAAASTADTRKLAVGLVDRIGSDASYRFTAGDRAPAESRAAIHDHDQAVRAVTEWLDSVAELRRPDAVGHRIVHGGDRFAGAALIDDDVIAALEALCELAPLHNPGALKGIRAAQAILGEAVPMVAVFDTSFHHTIPEFAATYALPYDLAQKHKIRRYGFHGLAHRYDSARYAALAGKRDAEVNVVTLHLGNGCSVSAIRGGRSLDTSMGFTPLEGLVMGTRSGDLDPALVSYLARKESVAAAEVEGWLNQRSGLLGISGLSSDMRELLAAYEANPRARLAVDVFCHRARKYLGAYLAVLGGAEAVIFSGGIGENAPLVRERICRGMEWCGMVLDPSLNAAVHGQDGSISRVDSPIEIFVIHTDEETIIARETARAIGG
jgi:acetate kinase